MRVKQYARKQNWSFSLHIQTEWETAKNQIENLSYNIERDEDKNV